MSTRLKSKTVLVTRRPEQTRDLAAAIEERGGRVVFAPMLEIADPPSWEECDRALERLAAYDAMVFASTNAVEMFLHRCEERHADVSLLKKSLLFAVGPATARALASQGFQPEALPDVSSATGLLESLRRRRMSGKRILMPRGAEGRQELLDGLRAQGAAVDAVAVYSTVAPKANEIAAVADELRKSHVDAVMFASPSAVRNFLSLLPQDLLPRVPATLPAIAIGPTTAEALRSCGWTHIAVSRAASPAGMADAAANYLFYHGKKI